MNVSELITNLEKQGHKVKFRRRSDGGILITQIDRNKYRGATGNMLARQLLGVTLSEARKQQLQMAQRHRERHISTRHLDLNKEIEKAQRRINRKRRKHDIKGGGIVTKSKIQYHIEHYGKEETIEALRQQERYAEHKAYDKNIQHLIDRFNELASITKNSKYLEIAQYIEERSNDFKEEWMQPIYYEVLNAIDRGDLSPEEAFNKVKMIMQ